jgi:hypothetical protein
MARQLAARLIPRVTTDKKEDTANDIAFIRRRVDTSQFTALSLAH